MSSLGYPAGCWPAGAGLKKYLAVELTPQGRTRKRTGLVLARCRWQTGYLDLGGQLAASETCTASLMRLQGHLWTVPPMLSASSLRSPRLREQVASHMRAIGGHAAAATGGGEKSLQGRPR